MSGELLRTGRKVGRTIYVQHGLAPSLDDPLIGIMDTADLAARVVEAVNAAAPVAGEDTAPSVGVIVPTQAALDALPKDTWVRGNDTAEAVKRGPGASGGWYLPAVNRLANEALLLPAVITALPDAPAQPALAPDPQRVAPNRDALVEAFMAAEVDSDIGEDGEVKYYRPARRQAERMADVALGVLRGGDADGSGEDEDPNLAHRVAINTAKLSGPDTRSLLICAREGRVGGAATIGDSRLNASIVWAMLGSGATPEDVHRSYPWCSVEDAAVLDRLRRDVVEHLDEDDEVADPCMEDSRGRCSAPSHTWHPPERRIELPWSMTRPMDFADEDEELDGPEPRCGAFHPEYSFTCRDLPKRHGRWHWDRAGGYWDHDGQHIDGMAEIDVARLARAAGVSPDSEDVVGAIEAAIRAGREPERMLGRDAEKLPSGSWVAHYADFDGGHAFARMKTATRGWRPENVTTGLVPHNEYVVLYRAPAPAPAPLTVGEVVEDPADLDRRATVGTIVEDAHANVGRRIEASDGEALGWGIAGLEGMYQADEFACPVRVVRVGTGGGES